MSASIRPVATTHTAIALILTLASGACATSPTRSPFTSGRAGSAALTLTVENWYHHDVHVYLLRGGARISGGVVRTAERRAFRFSSAELGHRGDIRLMADPIGSATPFVTDIVQVAPGERVEWTLAHALNYSRITVLH